MALSQGCCPAIDWLAIPQCRTSIVDVSPKAIHRVSLSSKARGGRFFRTQALPPSDVVFRELIDRGHSSERQTLYCPAAARRWFEFVSRLPPRPRKCGQGSAIKGQIYAEKRLRICAFKNLDRCPTREHSKERPSLAPRFCSTARPEYHDKTDDRSVLGFEDSAQRNLRLFWSIRARRPLSNALSR